MVQDSKKEIMEATYTALCKHGYADLSIQKIANEFNKGKSLIYYHYDDKEDLMLAFLDYMSDQIRQIHEEFEDRPAEERLDEMLDMSLGIKDDDQWEFQKAFLEIRAQAPHNDRFMEKFRETDSMVVDYVADIVDELGVEDPRSTAEILVSCIEGATNRKVSTGDKEGLKQLKDSIKDVARAYIVEGCRDHCQS